MVIVWQKRTNLLVAGLLVAGLIIWQSDVHAIVHSHKCAKRIARMQAAIKQRLTRTTRSSAERLNFVSERITPQNTIFLFDIDDVLLLIKKLKKAKFGLYLLMRPDVWLDIAKIKDDSSHSETMIKRNKKPGVVKRLKRMKYGKTPIEGMVEILRELKQRGYTLHIASNMTRADFAFYQQQYPGIFALFDAAFVIENSAMPQKPSRRYFDVYRATHPTDKQHFFVDDKEENCNASGFAYTHVFKNAQQLRLDLVARGVL